MGREDSKKVFVKPEQISDILITHSHWDHIDDIDKYTKSRIYLSQKTFDNAFDAWKSVQFSNRYNEAGVIPLPSHDGTILLRYRLVSEDIAQIV